MVDETAPYRPAGHPDPNRIPPRPKTALRILVAVGGGVILLAAIAAVVAFALTRGPSARDVAEEYLAHIAAGEASAALALQADPPEEVAALSDPMLLTDEVLGGAVERISDIDVAPTSSESGGYAAFDVSYSLAGQRYENTLTVIHEDGAWPDPGRWSVSIDLTDTLVVTQDDPAYRLSGVEMPTVSSGEFLPLAVYPAVYPIEAVDDTFYETDRDTLVAPGDVGAIDPVQLAPNAHFREVLTAQVAAFLDTCAAQTTWRPSGCPLSAPLNASRVPVDWTIEKQPTTEILLEGELFLADDGVVTATYVPEGAAEPVVSRESLGFGGKIEVDGDSLTIVYD